MEVNKQPMAATADGYPIEWEPGVWDADTSIIIVPEDDKIPIIMITKYDGRIYTHSPKHQMYQEDRAIRIGSNVNIEKLNVT